MYNKYSQRTKQQHNAETEIYESSKRLNDRTVKEELMAQPFIQQIVKAIMKLSKINFLDMSQDSPYPVLRI